MLCLEYTNKRVSGRRLLHVSAYLSMAGYLSVGIFAAVGQGSVLERTTLYLVFVTAVPMNAIICFR